MYTLGISGLKQSGKDTSCGIMIPILSKALSRDFKQQAFADAVKNVLCLFGYTDEAGNWRKVNKTWIEENKVRPDYVPGGWKMGVREALINIGDRFREICPSIWLDLVMNSIDDKIVSDVRYPNEAWTVFGSATGYVLRIHRDSCDVLDNPSETSLLPYDEIVGPSYEGPIHDDRAPYPYYLKNNGTVEELEFKLKHDVLPDVLRKWRYFI